MLETGQPLHAFDYHKLKPIHPEDPYPAIIVRRAKPQEEFIAQMEINIIWMKRT